jgi:hypothetical protein
MSAGESPSASWLAAFAHRSPPGPRGLIAPTVGAEGDNLQVWLATAEPGRLTAEQLRQHVEGNLWMLTPEAFRYFLPGFFVAGLAHYDRLGAFVAELVTALTVPLREDVVTALDRLERFPVDVVGMAPAPLGPLRQQQLDWFDSGFPVAQFQARIETLSAAESAVILQFLTALRDRHADDFPFDELDAAIDRHWARASQS